MVTKYPYKIDDNTSLPDVIDNITAANANSVNILKNAILAIENELGVKPSGVSGSVKERFISLENIIANIEAGSFSAFGDLTGTSTNQKVIGIQGTPVSNIIPTVGQALIFDGTSYIPSTPPSGGTFVPGGDLSGTDTSQNVIGLRGYNISPIAPTTNQILQYVGSAWTPTTLTPYTPTDASVSVKGIVQLSRDLGGIAGAPKVIGIQGIDISSTIPTVNQVLQYNGVSWIPATLTPSGAPTTASYVTLSTDANLSNERVLTAGTNISIVDSGAGNPITINSTYTYSPTDATTLAKGILQLSKDLGGTAALPTVIGIQGVAISSSSPTLNQVLQYNGTNWVASTLTPYTPVDASGVQKGVLQLTNDLGGTATAPTVLKINGVSISGIPASGNIPIATSATTATWQAAPTAAPTTASYLTLNTDATLSNERVLTAGTNISFNDGGAGSTLTINNTYSYTPTDATTGAKGILQLTRDLGGTAALPNVIGIQGRPITNTAPLDGQSLGYDSVNATWKPLTINLANSNAVGGVLPIANQSAQTMGGDVSGTTASATVLKVNGASYPSAGALVTGTIPRVTGSSSVSYGSLDLGNANAVTGILSNTNLPDATSLSKGIIQLSGDLEAGTADAPIVKGVRGTIMPPSPAPTIGQIMRATSSTAMAWGALDLANADAITGILPTSNLANSGVVAGTYSGYDLTIDNKGRITSVAAPAQFRIKNRTYTSNSFAISVVNSVSYLNGNLVTLQPGETLVVSCSAVNQNTSGSGTTNAYYDVIMNISNSANTVLVGQSTYVTPVARNASWMGSYTNTGGSAISVRGRVGVSLSSFGAPPATTINSILSQWVETLL